MTLTVESIWRYPVKSMLGEPLTRAEIGPAGVLGDRAFALLDESGTVASAKDVRRFSQLFRWRARTSDSRVEMLGPAGERLLSSDADAGSRLSSLLGVPVRLASGSTFFDQGTVHLVTTATLARLAELAPGSDFSRLRFRPNLLIHSDDGPGFIEQNWIGRSIQIGQQVRLRVVEACPRCVMTTLAQEYLPHDPAILKTIASQASGNVGVYAAVEAPGPVAIGDVVIVR